MDVPDLYRLLAMASPTFPIPTIPIFLEENGERVENEREIGLWMFFRILIILILLLLAGHQVASAGAVQNLLVGRVPAGVHHEPRVVVRSARRRPVPDLGRLLRAKSGAAALHVLPARVPPAQGRAGGTASPPPRRARRRARCEHSTTRHATHGSGARRHPCTSTA